MTIDSEIHTDIGQMTGRLKKKKKKNHSRPAGTGGRQPIA